ncbi:VCBS repeat-containing protein [Adhaeribacter swui]|uniref:VCBS repeat-containing protein n=1 Tax=Adhaeribacter swui TaxID=2086471 RepID=A0A7G7GBG0_9BACT|nr:VCBS repeat-containing protein [Adhaeribacter swui]QNF34494.1 VCBS repeat-containing protein [Adhaeribacter swui]
MRQTVLLGILLCYFSFQTTAQTKENSAKPGSRPVKFLKKQIAAESFETVAVFDVNQDKIPDLVSGAYWYEGPHFFKRHTIGTVTRINEYWDDFSTVALDVNKDGRLDFVTGGWFGKTLIWRENPGNDKEWPEHVIAKPGNIETTRSWDIDGDGTPDIIPNTPNDSLIIYRLSANTPGKFTKHRITGKHGHGLGFGDINGDGRGDLVVENGWLEAPAQPFTQAWTLHPDFKLGTASVPILVVDVNQDKLPDLIVGQAHGYGLHWYEQQKDKKSKKTTWVKHPIDLINSQYHTLEWVDIDQDGLPELITGKRYRAHNGNDPGETDPLGLYYFKWNGESFTKQVISYGPFGEGKGAGLYFSVADLTGSGRKDIVVAGKDGLYVFYNQGSE